MKLLFNMLDATQNFIFKRIFFLDFVYEWEQFNGQNKYQPTNSGQLAGFAVEINTKSPSLILHTMGLSF